MTSSLSKYIGATQQHVEELKQSLTEADLTELHQDLTALGDRDWSRWRVSNQAEIEAFLEATPTVRSRRKAWRNQSLRLRLIYGAILYAQDSEIVLSVLHQSTWIECASLAGYRDMTASAAELFYRMEVQITDLEDWPFHELDSPFQ